MNAGPGYGGGRFRHHAHPGDCNNNNNNNNDNKQYSSLIFHHSFCITHMNMIICSC